MPTIARMHMECPCEDGGTQRVEVEVPAGSVAGVKLEYGVPMPALRCGGGASGGALPRGVPVADLQKIMLCSPSSGAPQPAFWQLRPQPAVWELPRPAAPPKLREGGALRKGSTPSGSEGGAMCSRTPPRSERRAQRLNWGETDDVSCSSSAYAANGTDIKFVWQKLGKLGEGGKDDPIYGEVNQEGVRPPPPPPNTHTRTHARPFVSVVCTPRGVRASVGMRWQWPGDVTCVTWHADAQYISSLVALPAR